MTKIFSAGNKGTGIRSDCFVSIEESKAGGINIQLRSKVKALYEENIKSLTLSVLKKFEVKMLLFRSKTVGLFLLYWQLGLKLQ